MTYFLNASISVTMLSCLRVLNILTSLRVVFLTTSSSSDSLNFLMATEKIKSKYTYQLRRSLYSWLYRLYRKRLRPLCPEFHIYSLIL